MNYRGRFKGTFFCTFTCGFLCFSLRRTFVATYNSWDRFLVMGLRVRKESLPCWRKLNNYSLGERVLTIDPIVKDSLMDTFD